MGREIVKACMALAAAAILCSGCSEVGIGGNRDVVIEEELSEGDFSDHLSTLKEAREEMKRGRPFFDTDRMAVMDAIHNGNLAVKEDGAVGAKPECMSSCKALSGLFHVDVYDYQEKPEKKGEGTYMVQVVFYLDQLLSEDGVREAGQLFDTLCKALDIPYHEDIIWSDMEDILLAKYKDVMSVRSGSYQEDVFFFMMKDSQHDEIIFRLQAQED